MSDHKPNDPETRAWVESVSGSSYTHPLWTDEELVAIKALQRVAKKWPQTLRLFSQSGSLVVIHTADEMPWSVTRAWGIPGIPNDGGDADWEPS